MITICKECLQAICPASCPSYQGLHNAEFGKRKAKCFLCEGNIFELEKAFFFSDRALCMDCATDIVPDELLSFFSISNLDKFMRELGAKGQA